MALPADAAVGDPPLHAERAASDPPQRRYAMAARRESSGHPGMAWRRLDSGGAGAGLGDVATAGDPADRLRHPLVLRRAPADVERGAAVRADERSPDVLSIRRADPGHRLGRGVAPLAA